MVHSRPMFLMRLKTNIYIQLVEIENSVFSIIINGSESG